MGDFNTAFETARHDPARHASSSNSTAATAELPSCSTASAELLLDVGILASLLFIIRNWTVHES